MLKKISIILIILISVILLQQIDDELNPEIKPFLTKSKAVGTSEAYLYLLGIDTSADKNPSKVGKQLFASIRKKESLAANDIKILDTADKSKLPLPTGSFFCSNQDDNCFDIIFSGNNNLAKTLLSNAILLERYQSFITMTDYQTLSKPAMSMITPAYQYLEKGNRLVILKAISIAQASTSTNAIDILLKNVSNLRGHLKNADDLIGKMLFTALISHNLDALSLLIHQQKIAFNYQMAPISLAERNLETVMAREFAMFYELFISLDKKPDFFSRIGESNQIPAPGWLVRTVFKPNNSINALYPSYKSTVKKSQLEPKAFADIAGNAKVFYPQSSYIRNITGTILLSLGNPDFEQYIARLFDLNAKIALFNQTAEKTELPDKLGYIQNPYFEMGNTAYYLNQGKSICLTGPLEDSRNQRCLQVKI